MKICPDDLNYRKKEKLMVIRKNVLTEVCIEISLRFSDKTKTIVVEELYKTEAKR
jgi:hypothetical protein